MKRLPGATLPTHVVAGGPWSCRARRIRVRLLLSIDRREGAQAAMETVQLALQHKEQGVVGGGRWAQQISILACSSSITALPAQ